jgi:hypothetical protein
MRSKITVWSIALALGLAPFLAAAQEGRPQGKDNQQERQEQEEEEEEEGETAAEAVRMPLTIERGQHLRYRLTAEKSGRREVARAGQGEGVEKQPFRANLDILVREVAAALNTLHVRIRTEDAGLETPAARAAETPAERRARERHYAVLLGHDGRVRSIEPSTLPQEVEEALATQDGATHGAGWGDRSRLGVQHRRDLFGPPPEERVPEDVHTPPEARALFDDRPAARHHSRSKLQALFGAGLHEEELRPGEHYHLDLTGPELDELRRHPVHGEEWETFAGLRLRFDGLSGEGGSRLASFTIVELVPPEELRRERGAQNPRTLGHATYRLEDGALERLQLSFERTAEGEAPAHGSLRVEIERR